MVPPTMLDINIGTVCQNQYKFVTFVEVRRPVYSSKLEIMSSFELVQVAWVRGCCEPAIKPRFPKDLRSKVLSLLST